MKATRLDNNSIDYYSKCWIWKPSLYTNNNFTDNDLLAVYREYTQFLREAIFWEWSYGLNTQTITSSQLNRVSVGDTTNSLIESYDLCGNSWSLQFGYKIPTAYDGNVTIPITSNYQPSTLIFDYSNNVVKSITIPTSITNIEDLRKYLDTHNDISGNINWKTPRTIDTILDRRIDQGYIYWSLFNNYDTLNDSTDNVSKLVPIWKYTPPSTAEELENSPTIRHVLTIFDTSNDDTTQISIPLREYTYTELVWEIQKKLFENGINAIIDHRFELQGQYLYLILVLNSLDSNGAVQTTETMDDKRYRITLNRLYSIYYPSDVDITITDTQSTPSTEHTKKIPSGYYNTSNFIKVLQDNIDPEATDFLIYTDDAYPTRVYIIDSDLRQLLLRHTWG